MKATKWLGLFNTISAYLLPPTAAVVQNNLQSIRPGLLTPRLGLAARLGAQSGNAVLAMYRKTRAKLPDQLITYTFVKSISSLNATFTLDYFYAIQRTSQDPISLTYTTTTVYRDDGKTLQGILVFGDPVVVTSDTTGLAIGDKVYGTGVPEDAVIQAIDLNKSFTLSIAATLATVAGLTQSLKVFPGSVSVPSFAEDRFGRLYTFFGNGIKPQMLRTTQNFTVDVGIESPTAVPNVSFTKATMFVERIDVFGGSGGYTQPPQITFSGGSGGTGATAVAILDNGAISALEVTSGGSGYLAAPQVLVSDTRRGSGFIGQGVLTTSVDYGGFQYADVITPSTALTAGLTFASSLSSGGTPRVTQVGPVLSGTTVSGSNVITLISGARQLIAGMTVTGTSIPAGAIVTKVRSDTKIVISANATSAAAASLSLTFLNIVTLAYNSIDLTWTGNFPLLDAYYNLPGSGSVAYTGVSAVASISFTEMKTSYQLASNVYPTTSGSLNNSLYTAGTYFNINNRGYFGLVASQSTFRWGNWTRESFSRNVVWNPFGSPGPQWNGRFMNFWFPNYQFVTVWLHTGTKSSLAKEQWTQIECPVTFLSAPTEPVGGTATSGKAYIIVPLYPEQITEGIASPTGSNYDPPKIKVFLSYAPLFWNRDQADPFDGSMLRNAPEYQRNDTNGWLGSATEFERPVVDFWKTGDLRGWDSQSSYAIDNPGSGINQNATFLLRFASGCASHQQPTLDPAYRIAERTIPRAANSPWGVVEGGWGANAFDIKFTATSLENTLYASTSLPGAIKSIAVVVRGTGYPADSTTVPYATPTALITLNQYTTLFALSGSPINCVAPGATLYPSGTPVDRINTVTVNTGGANYAGQPTFVIETGDGSGYGAELSAVIDNQGTITDVKVIAKGYGFKSAPLITTVTTQPNLTAVMRPTFKGVYSCAYRYADLTDTVIGTCYACTVTGGTNQLVIQLDEAGAELVKTGYVLDGGLVRFQTKVTSLVGSVAGVSRNTTNRPSNSTLSFTATLTTGVNSFWSPSTTGILVGMGITNTTLIPAGTTVASYTSGTGATFNVTITSGVISVAVVNGGTGYTDTAPLILTTTGTGATGASFVAVVVAGVITGVTGTGGSGYATATAAVSALLVMSNPALASSSGTIVVNRILPVVSQAGAVTANSATVTLASTVGLQIGQHVRGTGIPEDTYILAIPVANQSITLSKLATVSSVAGGTTLLECGWLLKVRDMSLPITYSNFSPIQVITAGPTVADLPTGRLNWAWNANILTPERAEIVETWRTNGDQSLVFYKTEVWASATANEAIIPVANIVAIGAVNANSAALLEQNALRGYAAGSNDYDELSDEALFGFARPLYAALPVVLPNGGLNAYRFDQPRTDMRVCASYNDRLWYAVSTSGLDVNTIFFSEYDEFESCPQTNALTIQQNQKLTDSLTALMPYGSVLLAAQENHIYQITYSTDPAVDANIALLINRGVYNQRCWDIYDDEIYCLDRRGMYTMTAGGQVTSISDAVQSYWIDKEVEASRTESFFVKIDSRAAVVRAFVVINDSNAPGPNLVLCYSINTKTWWTETYPNSLTSSSSYRPESTLIHDDVYSAIDGTIYALDGKSDAGYRSITSVSLTSGGSGYVSPPKVTVTSAQGSGAKFQALLKNGVVTDILITDRGTDYGTVTDTLGYNANYNSARLFTCTTGHFLVPGLATSTQRYTDNTYRVPDGLAQAIAVESVPLDPTAPRIAFTATTIGSTNNITVTNPISLKQYQYLDNENGIGSGRYITLISGNTVTLSGAVLANSGTYLFHSYEPRTFVATTTSFTFATAAGWSAVSGYVTIQASSTAVIEQGFDNAINLTIQAPTNAEGATATAIAYCQNPPSEYVLTGNWVFTVTDSAAPQRGTALITFDTPHPFVRGQQVPIVFSDASYSLVNNPVHNVLDQNQQAGVPGNWYVKATTANTITVMIKARPNPNDSPMITSGKAQCTAQGLPNQLFTVGLQYKTGAMELVSDDNTPKVGSNFVDRSVTVLYQPTSEPRSLILREYYNNSSAPKINQMARNRGTGFIHELNGAQTVLDMASTRSPLGIATGVAKAIFGSRTAGDMSGADTHIAVELIVPSEIRTEIDAEAIQPILYGLTVNGIVVE